MFNIIKCSVKGPDLSSARVIANLRLTSPFDTWDLKLWSKELTTEVKGKEVTATYKRPYLLSPEGHVITTQLKAWNDAVGESLTPLDDLLASPYHAYVCPRVCHSALSCDRRHGYVC